MKASDESRAFTLIELLVVIAIIALLAAIVLASLSTARTKAVAAKVEGQMNQIRNAAELYYSSHGSYSAGNCSGGTLTGVFADPASGMLAVATSTVIAAGAANIDCGATSSSWSVAVLLPGTTSYYCVDNSGAARMVSSSTLGAVTGGTAYSTLYGVGGAHSAANGIGCN